MREPYTWGRIQVCESISERVVSGLSVNAKAVCKEDRSLYAAAYRYFDGGWGAALELAAEKFPEYPEIREVFEAHSRYPTSRPVGDGASVRHRRVLSELTQEALGELAGVSGTSISRMERGEQEIPESVWDTLKAVEAQRFEKVRLKPITRKGRSEK